MVFIPIFAQMSKGVWFSGRIDGVEPVSGVSFGKECLQSGEFSWSRGDTPRRPPLALRGRMGLSPLC